MKPEHSKIIEAMDEAWRESESAYRYSEENAGGLTHMRRALRAAAERGWVLAKRPERITTLAEVPPHVQDESMGSCRGAYRHGWSQCLDAIEAITLDEGQDNG